MNRKSLKFISPAGTAVFPRLNEPDTKFNPEGVYSCKLKFKPEDVPAALVEKLEALAGEKYDEVKAELAEKKQGAKLKSLTQLPVLAVEEDRETGEPTGYVTMNFKMKASGISKKTGKPWKRSPVVFDASKTKLDPVPNIWGGSVLKVAGEAAPYYMAKDNIVGVAYYLDAVQILSLVSGGGGDADSFGFGVEEGFTSEVTTEDGDGDSPDF